MTRTNAPETTVPALGIIDETTRVQHGITPFCDGDAIFKSFIDQIREKGAKARVAIYGCTLPTFFDALVAAKKAGNDVKAIFDHSQALGHAERIQIEQLLDAGLVDGEDFILGTSPKAHQIVHQKHTAIWLPGQGAQLECGSWNYSTSASKQANDILIINSDRQAAAFEQAWNLLWQWNLAHNAAMQGQITRSAA